MSARLAQLVEQLVYTEKVRSSSLLSRTFTKKSDLVSDFFVKEAKDLKAGMKRSVMRRGREPRK